MIPISLNPMGRNKGRGRLPAGYIELEYLESTGTQYIDTGIVPDDLTGLWELSSKRLETEDYVSSGTRNGNMRFYGYCGLWRREISYGRGSYVHTGVYLTNWDDYCDYRHNYRNSRTIVANDHVLASNIVTISGITSNIIMFGYSTGATTNVTKCRSRIKYLKLTQGQKLVRNFIPALDPTGRPCMFDTVTQQPFYNNGTGEFLWRAKLPKGYTAIEYLESTGTQRIFMPRISDLVNVTTEHTYTSINSARSCVEFWQNTIFLGIKNTGEFYFSNKTETLFSDGTTATVGTRYKMILNENGLTVNGHLIPGTRGVRERPEYVTVGLFSAQNADYQCWLKKYYWIETLSGKMVRCVVPALDASNRPCMYDLVKRKTYYNKGTGEFKYA